MRTVWVGYIHLELRMDKATRPTKIKNKKTKQKNKTKKPQLLVGGKWIPVSYSG